MSIYIGGENIISPLGAGAQTNFNLAYNGASGVRLRKARGFRGEDLFVSSMNESQASNIFQMVEKTVGGMDFDQSLLQSPNIKIIISSTKGDIVNGVQGALQRISDFVVEKWKPIHQPLLVSNACISGVQAINVASDYIENSLYDHVLVVGCDILSPFVINGFQSLYAISEGACQPYDQNRIGINLGEACATVLLSKSEAIFEEKPLKYLGGNTTNDANHISGPSRTGEGLYRSVAKTLKRASVKPEEVGYISAHGTATKYNDDMESIAFNRLGMSETPLNSMKGYFGHTLGTAGVIETAMSMQSLRNQKVLKSLGCENPGTVEPLNVLTESAPLDFNRFLKTASGFGGGNSSLIISK